MTDTESSQFYTGLVAELYEPLVSYRARAEEYVPFIERTGQPVLELCCGSGVPMLELRQLGYDIEGLDASADMLARCRVKAEEMGLEVALHHQEMQHMDLERRYRSIFLAGGSFGLLTTDSDAQEALHRVHRHLEPGGSALIPMELPDAKAESKGVGHFKELPTGDGQLLRVGMVEFEIDEDRRLVRSRLRYERVHADGTVDALERDWFRSWWSQVMFGEMLSEAGFAKATVIDTKGERAAPDATDFLFLARKG